MAREVFYSPDSEKQKNPHTSSLSYVAGAELQKWDKELMIHMIRFYMGIRYTAFKKCLTVSQIHCICGSNGDCKEETADLEQRLIRLYRLYRPLKT